LATQASARPAAALEEIPSVQFFNMKTKEKVDVPETHIKKRRSRRTTPNGATQERYAAVAEVEVAGVPVTLYKFVNRATFDSLSVPEID
jgi:hypothetical protein